MKYTMGSGMRRGHVVVLLFGVLGLTLSASAIIYDADMTTAARNGDIATVKRLLAEGQSINETYSMGTNALHSAVEGEHLAMVQFLLSKGININHASESGTPLDFALQTGNAEIIHALLNHSVKPKTFCGEVGIQAVLGNTKKVQELLKQEIPEIELVMSSMVIIQAGKPKMLPLFVPGKVAAADFHFLVAAEKGDIKSAEYLIKHGISIENNSKLGRQSLNSAMWHKRIPMLRWLLKKKVSPIKRPKEKISPIESALRTGNAEIVDLLISYGAKLHFKGAEAEKQLYHAVRGGNVELASRFLSKGVNPNTIDPGDVKSQIRLLHLAAGNNDVPMAKALVKAGADIHAKTKSGATPLDIAIKRKKGNTKMIQFLRSVGAKGPPK